MLIRFFMLGANHRVATVLFLAMVTCMTGLGLPRLNVDTGFGSLMPDSHPDKRIYDQIVREFGSDHRSIVYIRDKDLWSLDKMAALEKLHFALEKLECVKQVDDLFTVRSIRGSRGEIDSGTILNRAPENQAAIDQARADALYNPTLVDNFISRDGTALAIVVSLNDSLDKKATDTQVNAALELALSPFRKEFQEIFQVGSPRIHAAMKTLLFDDLKLTGPLSALALAAGILFFLGSGLAAIVPLITSGLSLLWTFGIMGWTHIPLTILTAMLPPLVIILGSTEHIHMMISYFQGVTREKENSRPFATEFMMKHMGIPLVLTVLTMAMGFAGNMFSNIGITRDFAVSATIAVLANGMISWLFVPMVFSTFGPCRTRVSPGNKILGALVAVFVKIFALTHQRFALSIFVATSLVCGFFGYQCSKLYVANAPLSYFKKQEPLVKEALTLHQNLAGMNYFYISLSATRDKAFLLPGNIKRLAAIQEFIAKQGVFDHSLSLADHLSLVNREFQGGNPEDYQVPDKESLVAQYLVFFHRRDLQNYVSHDLKRACIVVRHNINDSSLFNRHIRELKEVVPRIAGPGMTAHIVGENLMINGAAEDLIKTQIKSLVILLAVIFIITSIMFTSFKGGVIALITSLIPMILMFGIMGVLQIPLNPGTIMVAVISISIAVQGTLHLFSRYNELCRRTSDYETAVLTTVREEVGPMVTTSLALALGFCILLFSGFTSIAQFGALSAAAMIFALFANLLITPIIMSRVRLVGLYQILALKMHRQVLEKSPLFQGMTHYQMRKAILISELNEFEQGELLVKQGTRGSSMYLLLSGTAEIIRKKRNEEKSIVCLGPGQIFGEIGYVRQIRRTADVRALTPVAVLRFDYLKLEKDLKFFPFIIARLNFNISRILGERLADAYDALDENRQQG